MAKSLPTIAAIDLGSSKIAVLICEIAPTGLEVLGFGETVSRGIRKGVVVNIDSAVEAVKESMGEATNLSQREPDVVVCGVGGSHIQTMASHGMIPVRDKEIRPTDLERALEAASAISLPLDREVIQVLPQEYVVDGQDGIHEPVGMYGRRLEVNIQLVTAAVTTLQNIRRCLSKAELEVESFIANPVASSRSVVSEQDKEAGVCVVDIGAASTDIAVFQDGKLSWIHSLAIGGMHFTNDLAVGLKTNLGDAEKLKLQYGCVATSGLSRSVEIPGLAGCEPREIDKRMFMTILQPRVEEVLQLVRNELAKRAVDENLASGVVLTGGASALKGILEIAQRSFQLPVRLGRPARLGGLSEMISSPSYSSLVGLVQLGFEESDDLKYLANFHRKTGVKKVQAQFTRWIRDFF